MRLTLLAALAVATFGTAASIAAQEPELIAVGQMAPDFALAGATRYGTLEDPVRLSELRGNTVVLAFFFRARTRG
ncbi:MAG: hypothetical protein JSW71_06130 [Gemmatimonadota bacterium]|nr:MAG: hypothetical protein JSW71_06130 [Gemmatimonadota bacterium]